MYLNAEVYLSEYQEKEKALMDLIKENSIHGLSNHLPRHITYEIGYWRKANAIHKWFVDNVQEGEDDCESYYVPIEKLTELKEICEKILADNTLAAQLLPSASGFFFGSTQYDDWYFDDLKKTVLIINKVLENPDHKSWDIKYHSSW